MAVSTRKVVVPKGEPGNFLTEDELLAKFASLADPVLGASRAADLAGMILDFDSLPDVAPVLRFAA